MKILFVNSFYSPDIAGGAERSVKRLADLHHKAGHQVSALATHGGKAPVLDHVDGVAVHRIPVHNIYWHRQPDQPAAWKRMLWHGIDSYNPLSERSARRVLESVKPDIISCHNLAGLSISVWHAARQLKIPVVQVLRDYYNICPRVTCYRDGHLCERQCGSCGVFRLPHRAASNNVSAVVGCSQAVLQKHLDQGYFANVSHKQVIYNAEHTPLPAAVDRPADRPFTFGYIGALTEVKGITEMLDAVLQAQTTNPRRMRMLIAGTGPESFVDGLKTKYASADIEFLGHTAPATLFAQIDASIVPSVWDDPLPGVVFQALAHGLPVIGAARGAIPEMVKHEVNGLLYNPSDANALAGAITQMLSNDVLVQGLAKGARPSAAPFLDENRLFSDYMSLYGQVINQQ